MKIRDIEISGYRSIHDVRLQLSSHLTVVVGPNGSGKSNIYQSIALIAAAADGTFARRIVEEGGMNSILWAGARNKNEDYRVRLSVRFEELRYELEFGRIPISERPHDGPAGEGLALFRNDPDIKEEHVVFIDGKRKTTLLQRKRGTITARNMDGRNATYPATFSGSESAIFELREPHKYPELQVLHAEFTRWRFYHDFRTDIDSPIRQPQIGTLTPIMNNDGNDLIPALATIIATGDRGKLERAVERAFSGHQLKIEQSDDERQLTLHLSVPGLHRPLTAVELSDGTLQYLCLLGALLTPRPAPFMVLNEPETSIHPDLYEPLAELIVAASTNSQIFLTTHARDLADFIKKKSKGCKVVELEKLKGETKVVGAGRLGQFDNEDDDEQYNDE